jgi:hypothetical protein
MFSPVNNIGIAWIVFSEYDIECKMCEMYKKEGDCFFFHRYN